MFGHGWLLVLLCEYFFHDFGTALEGVIADVEFFFFYHREDTVHRFLGNVVIEAGVHFLDEGNFVVLGDGVGPSVERAYFIEGSFDDGLHFLVEGGGAGFFEVLGAGVFVAFEDGHSIVDGHACDGVDEDIFCAACCVFGSAVHFENGFIGEVAEAYVAEGFLYFLGFGGE